MPREDGSPRRGQRPPREPRQTGEGAAAAPASTFVDTIPVGDAVAEGAEGEREGRRRRRRRGGRRDEASADSLPPMGQDRAPINGSDAATAAASPAASEDFAPSPERREGAPVAVAADIAIEPLGAEVDATDSAARQVVAPPPAAAKIASPLPAFDLPTSELQQLADGAGLQWVQSDADKVRRAQEVIAAEPKPVHVPRERVPVVLPDDGPLVLVETRKDLSQLALPFERQAARAQAPQ